MLSFDIYIDRRRPMISPKAMIIAEIGKNFIQTEEERPVSEHLDNATKLVELAKLAGADAVKFQTHNVEDEILPTGNFTSPHFLNWDERKGGRYAWVERNQRATPVNEFWKPLKQFCDDLGIIFFSTPMSRGAAMILNALGVPFWKVGSGDILDFVMLDYLRNTGKPIILSSGMSTLEEIDLAMNFVRSKNRQVTLLHCVSKYPCPPEDLRLGTMELLRNRYGAPTGFSDHSIADNLAAVAAVALGAVIIEKHFSLNRGLWGPDHKASLTPVEFWTMVQEIREVENSPAKKVEVLNQPLIQAGMSDRDKVLQEGEMAFRPLFRKSLVYGADLSAGTVLTPEMIYAMRPQCAGGIPSERYEEVLGITLRKDVKKYDFVEIPQ